MALDAVAVETGEFTAEQLVKEAQAYSQEAWVYIFDSHYQKMFRYCYLRTGSHEVSEDLASDVFLEALRGIGRYRDRGIPLAAWLYRIAHNVTADYLERERRRPTVPLQEEISTHPKLRLGDESDSVANRHDVQAAMRQLTDDQQQVILLRFFQGLSHNETAAVMGRRSGAVRVLQTRALNALRRVMAA